MTKAKMKYRIKLLRRAVNRISARLYKLEDLHDLHVIKRLSRLDAKVERLDRAQEVANRVAH